MKNNEIPEGQSDNPKGDPDDDTTSGEDTLETDGGGEALEEPATLQRMGRKKQVTLAELGL
jgi:hypothetical protein